jgi:hypothetical protein
MIPMRTKPGLPPERGGRSRGLREIAVPGPSRNRGPGAPAKSRWWGADFVGWGGGVRISWGGVVESDSPARAARPTARNILSALQGFGLQRLRHQPLT